jgi:hypothetical protein
MSQATTADMVHAEERLEVRRQSVYSGPVLFVLVIMFLVVGFFTDKSKGSNFIEH